MLGTRRQCLNKSEILLCSIQYLSTGADLGEGCRGCAPPTPWDDLRFSNRAGVYVRSSVSYAIPKWCNLSWKKSWIRPWSTRISINDSHLLASFDTQKLRKFRCVRLFCQCADMFSFCWRFMILRSDWPAAKMALFCWLEITRYFPPENRFLCAKSKFLFSNDDWVLAWTCLACSRTSILANIQPFWRRSKTLGSGVEGEYFNLRYSVFRCSPGVNIPIPW